MDSGHLFFDPSCRGSMLFMGNADPPFRGQRTLMHTEETSKRRLFFGSPDDLYDEGYYDEQLPEKKRRLTCEQVLMLEKSFEAENKLEPERKIELAEKLRLQPRQVAVWFQNRRARCKTKQLERDYDLLKSSYDSLLSDHDSILKHNEKLKAEVDSLAEKLQAKEVAGEPLPVDNVPHVSALQLVAKVEDRLSTGSGGSAVVDDEGPQLVDSGNSYFPTNDYIGCVDPLDVVQSQEDGCSDEGQSYFSNVVMVAEQQNHEEEGEPLGFWVWS